MMKKLCECGCGKETGVYTHTHAKFGIKKGAPTRFLRNHRAKIGRPVAEKFFEKVDKNGPIPAYRPDLGQCWIWIAALDTDGYGMMMIKEGMEWRTHGAHVISWMVAGYKTQSGKELDHLCRNIKCVNPAHLELVTHKENMMRGEKATKTHCKRGHPFNQENTRIIPTGGRQCKSCRESYMKKWLLEHPDYSRCRRKKAGVR